MKNISCEFVQIYLLALGAALSLASPDESTLYPCLSRIMTWIDPVCKCSAQGAYCDGTIVILIFYATFDL